MAVVFDATSEVNDGGVSGTSLSLTTLTVGSGNNRALVACIMFAGVPTGITLTWDSGGTNQAMTAITGASTSSGGTTSFIQWFGLVNPVSGNKTLKASWTGSDNSCLGAVSFTGVDQTGGNTTFPHGNSGTNTSSSPSVSITSATNNATVASFQSDAGKSFSAPNQTQTWLDNANSLTTLGQRAAGAASVSFTGTLSASKIWTAAGTDILAAAGLNPGAQVTDLPPGQQVVRGYGRSADLSTWARSNQIPPSQATPRGAYYALPYPTPPPLQLQQRSLERWYNLNLIGQDKMITGKQVSDLPPRAPPRLEQTWIESPAIPAPVVTLPNGEQVFDLPPLAIFWDRTWALNLSDNTLGPVVQPQGEQVFDLAPRAPPRPDETWSFSYILSLIGQDQLPNGEQVTELAPRAYPLQLQQRSWQWWYSLDLIGQDQLLVGEQVTDLAPRGYPRLDQTWTLSFFIPNLPTPPGENVYDLSPRQYPPRRDATWTWSYNLNLIGQDKFPPGENVTDLWPRPYPRQDQQRPWASWYNLTLIGKDQLPAGEQVYELVPRGYPRPDETWTFTFNIAFEITPAGEQVYDLSPRPPPGFPRSDETWTWWYNLNLIGQDQLPVGDQFTVRPPPLPWFRDWSLNLLETTLAATVATLPNGTVFDLSLPRAPAPLTPSWTSYYDLNLIGQDQLPTGEQSFELYPRPPAPQPPSWTWSYNVNLIGQDTLPARIGVIDNPAAVSWYRDWAQNLQETTLSSVAVTLPYNQYDWPLPRSAPRPDATWIAFYDLNLIGQDQLPTGARSYERPPPISWYRDWAQNSLENTLGSVLPHNQYDWPLPRSAPRPEQSWYWSYSKTLIGQDKLPTGEQRYDRPPPVNWLRDWGINLGTSTLAPAVFLPPGESTTDLARGAPPPVPSWTFTYNPNLVARDVFPSGKVLYTRPDVIPILLQQPIPILLPPSIVPPVPPAPEVPPSGGGKRRPWPGIPKSIKPIWDRGPEPEETPRPPPAPAAEPLPEAPAVETRGPDVTRLPDGRDLLRDILVPPARPAVPTPATDVPFRDRQRARGTLAEDGDVGIGGTYARASIREAEDTASGYFEHVRQIVATLLDADAVQALGNSYAVAFMRGMMHDEPDAVRSSAAQDDDDEAIALLLDDND